MITRPVLPLNVDSQLALALNSFFEQVVRDQEVLATAAPTTGAWKVGQRVWNSAPSAGGTMGWVCVTAGTPGTWKTFGDIAA